MTTAKLHSNSIDPMMADEIEITDYTVYIKVFQTQNDGKWSKAKDIPFAF